MVLFLGMTLASAKAKKQPTQPSLTVVTTIFPQYDWVREILGDKISQCSLTLLLDNGVDLHSYQPTVQDIAKISDCDVFIYVGGESDRWVPSALKNARNKNMQVVNLLEVLGEKVVEEEIVEGMQADEDDEHAAEGCFDKDDDEEEAEYDEHVWLSLKNAVFYVNKIAEELAASFGEDTVYNYVHPNNRAMIAFLREKGYSVLNLLEIRKPYAGEKLTRTIRVDEEQFDY